MRWTGIFFEAPLDQNLPVLLALLGIWYNNFLGRRRRTPSCRMISTCTALLRTSAGDMESNGKSVDNQGDGDFVPDTGADHLGRTGHQRSAFVLPV
jgi:glucose-6-phosphate isomerase